MLVRTEAKFINPWLALSNGSVRIIFERSRMHLSVEVTGQWILMQTNVKINFSTFG